MSRLDVLRAATVVPAGYFGLGDRGSVGVGKRADLVLVDGNPLEGTLKGRESFWSSVARFMRLPMRSHTNP
jgi:imidazolonepropionase-like amidohydrolase